MCSVNMRLALFLGIIFGSASLVRSCDLGAINQCILILGNGTDIDMVGGGIAAIPSAEQLKKMCSKLGSFESCYLPKAANCANDVVYTMTFGTIEKTINYLCVEGYKDILRHETCWVKTEVTEGTTQCHSRQTEAIDALKATVTDRRNMKEQWCSILENTTACVESAIYINCGTAPACIMKTMLDRALVGLADLMKCALPTPCNVTISTVDGGDNITSTSSSTSLDEWTTTITDNNAATAKNNHFMLPFIVISFLKLCEYR